MRLTFAPAARCVPRTGFWTITLPFLTVEYFLVMVPVRPCAPMSARFAAASVLPFTRGTMQASEVAPVFVKLAPTVLG